MVIRIETEERAYQVEWADSAGEYYVRYYFPSESSVSGWTSPGGCYTGPGGSGEELAHAMGTEWIMRGVIHFERGAFKVVRVDGSLDHMLEPYPDPTVPGF